MNQHLSGEQISKCLIGDGSPEETQHALECSACRAELAGLESSLSQFRASVRHWSDRVGSTVTPWDVNFAHQNGLPKDGWIMKGSTMHYENHLNHLLTPASLETPFYKSLLAGIKEMIRPTKLPPLEVTSKPVKVATLEGLYSGNEVKAGLSGLLVNFAILGLLVFAGTLKPVQKAIQQTVSLIAPVMEHKPAPKKEISQGGGGSPDREVTQNKLPNVAPRQFAPPKVTVDNPKLSYNPSIVAPDLPNIASTNYGDPLAGIGLPGTGAGIGKGIGNGKGNGVGPGSGGGIGGGVYKIGGGVSAPKPTFQPEPEYSEEARKAKWSGSVRLSLVVDEKGVPQEIKVVKPLGLGLDEKAIEAVQKWRFLPGLKDGKPVPVEALIDVTFHLL